MISYTVCALRVCAALLMVVYSEYRLWYVPPDIMEFVLDFWMVMAVVSGYISIVREVLELLEVMKWTFLKS